MRRNKMKKLTLSKETLKTLQAEELRAVAGRATIEEGDLGYGIYSDPCTPWCSIPSHYICCA